MEKKYLLLIFSVLVVVSFLFMVSAVTTMNPTLPAVNFTNISGSSYALNVTILNGGPAGNTTGNVTFSYQPWSYTVAANETWITITTVVNTSENQWYFNTTWDTTAVADGKNYTLNFTAYDHESAYVVNATNVSGNMTMDNTAPTVAVYGSDGTTAYANGTSIKTAATFANNLTLNISVTDATIGMANQSADAYCFINVNGGLNHTVPFTVDQWCNSSDINITDLSDGNNTINIYVNDTLTNLLNSTLVVQIDTTDPSATATCSPTSLHTGDSFPCSCSGADATSGVSTSTGSSTSGSITGTPSTGSFTYTCSVTDNGGLTSSATKTYIVEQSSSWRGDSGTTTPSWTTHVIGDGAFEQGHTRQLAVRNRLKVQVSSEDHFVGVLSITEDKVTIEISSDPVQVTLAVGEDAKADVNGNGFYDIYVLLNGIIGNNANVTIQKINEEVPEGGSGIETGGEVVGEDTGTDGDGDGGGIPTFVWILIILVVLILIWKGMKKKGK